jgi:hypothetical protein
VASADAAGVIWAIANYLAVGAEHGILQADHIDIGLFTRVHEHLSVVVYSLEAANLDLVAEPGLALS